MGFAGPLKRLRHGNGICRTTKKIAAWQWDSLARLKDCGGAMGFARLLKRIRRGNGICHTAEKIAVRQWDLWDR
jgi:hypothetical protein